MSLVGDLERFFAEVVFPLRLPLAVLAAVVVAGLIFLAWRRRWDRPVRRHPRAAAAAVVVILAVTVPLGWVLGSPLFIRTALDEPMPAADTPDDAVVALSGTFVGADEFHFGRGTASILVSEDGSAILRFEDFSVLNGPDLRVYLSPDPAGYSPAAIEVGPLRATDGSFNYELGTADLDAVRSVVIWCEPFGVLFASATLTPG